MEIVFLTNGIYPYSIGGMQKHSYFLAKELAKKKIAVEIYYPDFLDENPYVSLKDYFESEELSYLSFNKVRVPKVLKFPGHYVYTSYLYSKELYKLENGFKPLVYIYAQGFTAWYFLRKYPFQKNVLTNLHGLEMFQYSIDLKNFLEQFILKIPAKYIIRNSKKQISLGGKLTKILLANGAEKNSVVEIPNGIDRSWISIPNRKKVKNTTKTIKFVFVGRCERRKGIEELNKVVIKTIEYLDYEIYYIGPIPESKQIKNEKVHYLGQVNDSTRIRDVLCEADVLICPSYAEGMPTVILEAMACSCAIIASNVGAINTMVSSENGLLIDHNSIEYTLELAINNLMSISRKELDQKKRNSVKKVSEMFTWDKIVEKTLKEINV